MNLGGLLDNPKSSVQVGFRPISVEARRALKMEIVPSRPPRMAPEQFVQEMTAQLRTALKDKDEWYTRLIRYKAIDQVDETYFEDLIRVLEEWASNLSVEKTDLKETPQPPETPENEVQKLKDSLVRALNPAQNLTPWALTASLNDLFREHRLKAKAQVIPASLEKMGTSDPRSRKVRQFVAVLIGEGFTPMQVNLRHFPGVGWFDPMGIGSPEDAVKSVLGHIVNQMF